ncbi:ABC transporter ATP-binding protein [Companilactobacillus pabuli]|uniref:ATP-binding cassette domain-containing protein n=1 Tax=Companilactobacillus pabuli TaxID=2714036 RepID=A0A7L7KZA1_9LACO|nr:ATP-binding cassette domain-containing protein [Companilactobacillus pabuli]AKP02516.1 spermidine/putrescine ABC transporter ATP-binding protein [Companilactobacillus farciminis]AKS50814.1 spermidine/putrescine ABC transporter ATP-binding protein [Companilactobacillus farciminis]MDG5113938.1 ATP-binding cassette domain-containing protein [Companilactobacillus pabuli]QMT84692.1 ATP-binding cassette domain-containing protein [Companilactobacillus pabuli]GAQ00632.1 putrescine/spermidine ABC tr
MENIFQIKHLFYKVGETTILKDINLEIQKGKYITVVGPSGSGKSTLMRILASMISSTSGEVIFNGKSIETYDPILYRQKVSYAFQQPTLFGKTVRENLEFPFEVRKEEIDENKIIDYLKMVNLDESYIDKSVNDVSGGEKQRIALLRNLLFPPEVLITDEVTAGLDAENKEIVHKMLNQFNQRGLTILRVTHDETEIEAAADKITIRKGELVND